MKKIFASILLLSIVGLFMMPLMVSAQASTIPEKCTMKYTITNCPVIGQDCSFDSITHNCGMCCTLNTIRLVTDWIFYILILIVVIMFIIGGFFYITAAGDPEKAAKGKQVITFAIIGLAIALLAKFIPALVKFFLAV